MGVVFSKIKIPLHTYSLLSIICKLPLLPSNETRLIYNLRPNGQFTPEMPI